ncbi:MAG: DinB family protein [Chitinophagaceae bacterium]|nr:DinB family protein [Chitinophagaceae bacterium]
MVQIKWFERKFDFTSKQNTFPSIVERLIGTPIRIEEKCKTLSSDNATKRIHNTWSIKENIGHLVDMEPLWQGRFEDIKNSRALRTADLQNTKTNTANHNNTPLEDLFYSFRTIRKQTILLLENIDEHILYQSGIHPRLKIPMRTIDLFLFVAEHDDHHLSRITEIIKLQHKKVK